jgi:hypothetical protein
LLQQAFHFTLKRMQIIPSLQKPDEPRFFLEPKPVFTVLIIYEDFAAGKHAKETYDYLASQLGCDFEFKNLMWKFEVLGSPKMKEMALDDAREADLIIIATHGIGDLPEEVKSWIDLWSERSGNAMALVTLVDRPKNLMYDHTSLRSYLHDAAKRAGTEFFAQPDDWPDDKDDFSIQEISERARKTSTAVVDIVHHNPGFRRWGFDPGYQGWGINE